MATTSISIRVDSEVKEQAEHLFADLGMNMSTAFNIFVRQALREGGLPFQVSTKKPNEETIAAMLEAQQIARDPHAKKFSSVNELLEDLYS
ncbi:MAG: type II toxin-antitoxin system RelB/DinJ family antitoxin [Rothia sp. (in: high G+C Gram-positive bacteria)]|nr:type II toxin-antitoxin system RelB/DinJ family antitoxin [Rothia sp. (in: high G+C Gram-positive bacteria)]